MVRLLGGEIMLYVYVAALIVGGALLVVSLVSGDDGDLSDVDGDGIAAGGASSVFWALRSLRFWMFFLAFFGVTGLVLTGFGLVGAPAIGAAFAVGVGAVSGGGAAFVTRWLHDDESGAAASSEDYVGRMARVLVPVERGGTGKVRLELRGSTVDVLATTDEEQGFQAKERAMIVEMNGNVARVARVELAARAGEGE